MIGELDSELIEYLSGAQELDHQTRSCMRLWAASLYQKLSAFAEERAALNRNGPFHYWLDDDRDDTTGSFLWCCDLFQYDPAAMRDAVRRNWRSLVKQATRSAKNEKKTKQPDTKDESNGDAMEVPAACPGPVGFVLASLYSGLSTGSTSSTGRKARPRRSVRPVPVWPVAW